MPKYIDADKLMKTLYNIQNCPLTTLDMMHLVEFVPTADVVEKEKITEYITNELTNKISERIIQFLEANYEIIPKKPAAQCRNCKWRDESTCLIHGAIWKDNDFCSHFCSQGKEREEVDLTKMRVNIEETWI